MSFLRPEAVAALRLWGEPAALVAAAGVCLWYGVSMTGRGAWIGVIPLALGLLVGFAAIGLIERAWIAHRGTGTGPGVVSVHERRITYYGPHGGAAVSVDALVRIDIASGGGRSGTSWELYEETGERLSIPATAVNADALADHLGALPGFNNMSVVLAMRSPRSGRSTIWRRGRA